MKFGYKHTFIACCTGYVVQAIINNFSPLLYAAFSADLGISLSKISLLIALNFTIQICMDFAGTLFVDKIGYRKSVVAANFFAIVGLLSLSILPRIMTDKFLAIMISTILSAIGGGLLEVVVSPIVEAIPSGKSGFSMNFLHSFYCWGHAGVIIISTLFFGLFSVGSWYILAALWCIVPIFSGILFILSPINSLGTEKTKSSIKYLFSRKQFWLLMVVMLAAGSSELGMSQWASFFAERGLNISKTLGDLLGPCAFAITMGLSRLLFGLFGSKLKIQNWITASFVLCVISYLISALAANPFVSLVGCAICGISVAILWPGSYTLGAEMLPHGGTPMFALFALAGDVGCAAGPALIGLVSDAVADSGVNIMPSIITGGLETVGIKMGILLATIFPLVAIIACSFIIKLAKSKK